jgi:hypothetical protein
MNMGLLQLAAAILCVIIGLTLLVLMLGFIKQELKPKYVCNLHEMEAMFGPYDYLGYKDMREKPK